QAEEERQGPRGTERLGAVHRPSGRARVAVRTGWACRRAAADALRAVRVAARQPALSEPAEEPDGPDDRPGRESVQRRVVSLRPDELPPDGAPHRRWHVKDLAVFGRAAA